MRELGLSVRLMSALGQKQTFARRFVTCPVLLLLRASAAFH